MSDFDVILAGGGLSTGLIATVLGKARPQLRIAIVEQGPSLGGNHTWSFHASDVGDDIEHLAPMVRCRWSSQDVLFPAFQRTLETPYATIVSKDFDRHLRSQSSVHMLLDQRISSVSADEVVVSGGRVFTAPCVIDGRGWQASHGDQLALAYQKFFGLEVELEAPHGLERPIIMDATVAQTDGYRFVYCLPYTETTLLIEDTYYSTTAQLDAAEAESQVRGYAQGRGWKIRSIRNEENGCLPIVLAGSAQVFDVGPGHAAPCGLRAGLFHPTTGYSLPDAVKLAKTIARQEVLTTPHVQQCNRNLARSLWKKREFYRLLNRLLFVAARGQERRHVMQRFYRLPRPLIERFYAGCSTMHDKFRVLSGKPPIPIMNGLRVLTEQSAWRFVADGQGSRKR